MENDDHFQNTNFYSLLGINPTASMKEIIQAFRQMALKYHPDKNREDQGQIMRLLTEAKRVLTNSTLRVKYDKKLAQNCVPDANAIPLPMGRSLSEELKAKIAQWEKSAKNNPGKRDFTKEYQNEMDQFLKTDISPQKPHSNNVPTSFFVEDLFDVFGVEFIDIKQQYDQMRTSAKNVLKILRDSLEDKTLRPSLTTKEACFYNLGSISQNNLRFIEHFLNVQNVKELAEILPRVPLKSFEFKTAKTKQLCSKCQPRTSFFGRILLSSPISNCVACGNPFCEKCLKLCCLHHLKETSLICMKCYDIELAYMSKYESHAWLNKALESKNCKSILPIFVLLSSNFPSLLRFKCTVWNNFFQKFLYNYPDNVQVAAIVLVDENATDVEISCAEMVFAENSIQMAQARDKISDKLGLLEIARKLLSNYTNDERFCDKVGDQLKIVNILESAIAKKQKIEVLLLVASCQWDQLELLVRNNSKETIMKLNMLLRLNEMQQTFLETVSPISKKYYLLFLRGIARIKTQTDVLAGFKDMEYVFWYGYECLLEKSPNTGELLISMLIQAIESEVDLPYYDYKNIIPKDYSPPQESYWQHLSAGVPEVTCMFENYEAAVLKKFNEKQWSSLDVALSYFDLSSACIHFSQYIVTLVNSTLWFLKALTEEKSPCKQEALKCVIFFCAELTQRFAFSIHVCPSLQLYSSRYLYLATKEAGTRAGSAADAPAVAQLLRQLVVASRFCPVLYPPKVLTQDATLYYVISSELEFQFMINLQRSTGWHPVKPCQILYRIFENDFTGRCKSEENELRFRTIEALLKNNGWNSNDVVSLLQSPLMKYSSDGWVLPGKKLMGPYQSDKFEEFVGMVFDLKDHTVNFLIKKGPTGVFSMADIQTGFFIESSACIFSLDPIQPDQQGYNPLQKMTYLPKELQGRSFLRTMFQTDYLLKQFSTGVAVSVFPPFETKLVNSSSLYDGMPQKLRSLLKSVPDRGGFTHSIARFWIQADEMDVEQFVNGSQLYVLFGNVKMSVHTKPMFPSSAGELNDIDDENTAISAEATFAKDFTSCFSEVSDYHPEFKRLTELTKLQFIGSFLDQHAQCLEKCIKPPTVIEIEGKCKEIHEKMYEEQFSSTRTSLKELRRQLPSYVPPSDYNIIANQFWENFNHKVPHSALQKTISSWLNGAAENDLANTIVAQLVPSHKDLEEPVRNKLNGQYNEQFQKVKEFKTYIASVRQIVKQAHATTTTCSWVPAAQMKTQETETRISIVYGGVNLIPTKINTVNNIRCSSSYKAAEYVHVKAENNSLDKRNNDKVAVGFNRQFGSYNNGCVNNNGGAGSKQNNNRVPTRNDVADRWHDGHQWNHVFISKPGHINPATEKNKEKWKDTFIDIANTGLVDNKRAKVEFDEELRYRNGNVSGTIIEYWVLLHKPKNNEKKIIKSAGINQSSEIKNKRITVLGASPFDSKEQCEAKIRREAGKKQRSFGTGGNNSSGGSRGGGGNGDDDESRKQAKLQHWHTMERKEIEDRLANASKNELIEWLEEMGHKRVPHDHSTVLMEMSAIREMTPYETAKSYFSLLVTTYVTSRTPKATVMLGEIGDWNVSVRDYSKDGRPTVQFNNKKKENWIIKIRYNE